MLPRIFIGGTGRSGTTVLYKALGSHEAVYSLPMEMRFLVDPDGLVNLLDALSVNYSPVRAREALFRFERLMRVDLTTPHRAPFLTYDLANWLGGKYYWQRLDQFCSDLVELEYKAISAPVEPGRQGKRVFLGRQLQRLGQRVSQEPVLPYRATFNWPRSETKVVKFFSDRNQLMKLAADFADDLFFCAAQVNGKQTWCEKTPQNLFHIDFLWELFPQSVFIHIKRDPRGVVHSVMKQHWGPNDVEGVCVYLRAMYDFWFGYKRKVDLENRNYLELKLEDLAVASRQILDEVASFCGLNNHFGDLPDISLDKVNYWQRSMTKQEIEVVNRALCAYIEQMGYDV